MKITKVLTAFSLFLLSIALVAVGVYVATSTNEEMGVGGQITIPANEIEVLVVGYVGDADANSDGAIDDGTTARMDYNSSVDGDSWLISENDLLFDADNRESIDDVPKVVLTIQMVNFSEVPLVITYTPSEAENNLPNSIIDMVLYNGANEFAGDEGIELAGEVGAIQTIKVVLSLKYLVEEDYTFAFDYILNFIDARPVRAGE